MKKHLYLTVSLLCSACANGPTSQILEGTGLIAQSEQRATSADRLTNPASFGHVNFLTLVDPEDRSGVARQGFSNPLNSDNQNFVADTNFVCKIPHQIRSSQHYANLMRPSNLFHYIFSSGQEVNSLEVARIQCVFNAFYTYDQPKDNDPRDFKERVHIYNLERRRNSIQDFIIAASESSCQDFKSRLNDKITKANFGFGSFVVLSIDAGDNRRCSRQ